MKLDFECDPELGQPTNNQRARWANTALSAFVNECGDAGDEQDNIADLICDLLHLCDALGVEWQDALEQGEANYRAETTGEEAQPKADASFGDWKE